MAGDDWTIDELETLLALDALDADEHVDAQLALGGSYVAGLSDVAAALAESEAADPPPSLRRTALSAALVDRAAGTSLDGVAPLAPADAFAAFVADLRALLDELAPDEWSEPAHPAYGSVRDLVAHLVGVEEIMLGWCGARDLVAADDHVAATRDAVASRSRVPGPAVAEQWHALAQAADPARPVVAHDIPTDVDGVLVLRSFELWSHADDVRRATGRPVPPPDPAAMALLSSRLMRVAGLAPAFRGVATAAGDVRFVLTGQGGGTYDVELARGDRAPDATIVVDVVDLCRVAARRLPVDELEWALEGDRAIAELLLAHVDAFARD